MNARPAIRSFAAAVVTRFVALAPALMPIAALAGCATAAPATPPPTTGAASDVDKPIAGPPLQARDLGTVGPGQCSTTAAIAQLGASCAGLKARNAQAAGAAGAAADGDACTVWNSGDVPPQSIIVELEKDATFSALLLVPEMTPAEGDVVHVVEQSNDGDRWTTVGVLKAHMADDHVYGVTMPTKVTARFVRVTTHASPSWVAWAEVEPLRCN